MADEKTSSRDVIIYNPEYGVSYIDHGDGSASVRQGDLRAAQMHGGLKPTATESYAMRNAGKDLLENMATQIPLAVPGVGTASRMALSTGVGALTDQVINPENSGISSIGDAALKTLVGRVAEGLAGGTLKLRMPSVNVGTSRFGLPYMSLKGLSPLRVDPLAVSPGSDVMQQLQNFVPQSTVGPGGKWLKAAAVQAIQQANTAAKRKIVLDALKDIGMTNILPGVGANELFDLMGQGMDKNK